MRSSYLSPSPPISGRDISALAVIRRPSWSGAARTGSYDGSSTTAAATQVTHPNAECSGMLCMLHILLQCNLQASTFDWLSLSLLHLQGYTNIDAAFACCKSSVQLWSCSGMQLA